MEPTPGMRPLAALIEQRLPGAKLRWTPPPRPTGTTFLDVDLAGLSVVVEGHPGKGFAVALGTDDEHEFAEPPNWFESYEGAAERVCAILGPQDQKRVQVVTYTLDVGGSPSERTQGLLSLQAQLKLRGGRLMSLAAMRKAEGAAFNGFEVRVDVADARYQPDHWRVVLFGCFDGTPFFDEHASRDGGIDLKWWVVWGWKPFMREYVTFPWLFDGYAFAIERPAAFATVPPGSEVRSYLGPVPRDWQQRLEQAPLLGDIERRDRELRDARARPTSSFSLAT